jgi:acetyl esterase/lipase
MRHSTSPPRSRAVLLALALGLPLAAPSRAQAPAGAPAAQPSVALPSELARVLRDYEAAWRKKDAAGLAALFAEDAFVMSGDRPPVRGRAAIAEHYKRSGGPLALRAIAFSTDGALGYVLGGFARREGENDIGKFTLTLRRASDGRWLIVSDMDNGNGPPAPLAPPAAYAMTDVDTAHGDREFHLLWPQGAPGALGTGPADQPKFTVYRAPAETATGTAVIVCPGGGYSRLASDHEGRQFGEWLNSLGVSAFVLQYRLGPRYRHPAPLQDVLRAIRLVRSRAAELGVKPDRIGVMGFSAGGHLASSAATLFDLPDGKAKDGLEAISSRPDFAILGYPVIVFGADVTHKGSEQHLLGDTPAADLVTRLSTDRQVTAKTPPTFLFHTNEDAGVPPQNSIAFYLALKNAGVPAELHIYEKGPHGYGLGLKDPVLKSWPERLTSCLPRFQVHAKWKQ